MRLISPQECSYFINRGLSVELCARGEQEPCSGYSGAPLFNREGDYFFLVKLHTRELRASQACILKQSISFVFLKILTYDYEAFKLKKVK